MESNVAVGESQERKRGRGRLGVREYQLVLEYLGKTEDWMDRVTMSKILCGHSQDQDKDKDKE